MRVEKAAMLSIGGLFFLLLLILLSTSKNYDTNVVFLTLNLERKVLKDRECREGSVVLSKAV